MHKKVIVLDLDETLVHTYEASNSTIRTRSRTNEAASRIYSINVQGKEISGVFRPHIDEFINFCLSYFDEVIVWSAGIREYVDEIVRVLFRGRQPDAVYARDKCQYKNDLYLKPLEVISNSNRTMGSMIIIDDRLTTFSSCNPHNGILMPSFAPALSDSSLGSGDSVLIQLIEYFLHPTTKATSDVRNLDKERIFNVKPKYGLRDLASNRKSPTLSQLGRI